MLTQTSTAHEVRQGANYLVCSTTNHMSHIRARCKDAIPCQEPDLTTNGGWRSRTLMFGGATTSGVPACATTIPASSDTSATIDIHAVMQIGALTFKQFCQRMRTFEENLSKEVATRNITKEGRDADRGVRNETGSAILTVKRQ
ncbi:hypothetical protein MTO96_031012 [Rhipicephalus appendiculatus]